MGLETRRASGLAIWLLPLLMGMVVKVSAAEGVAPGVQACLSCHANTNAEMTFADGTRRSVRVPEALFRKSIHGAALLCTECHRDLDPASHPKRGASRRFQNNGDFVARTSEACQRCHYSYYTRVMDSIHRKLREAGKVGTPACVDCHPAHSMSDPRSPRAISANCGGCHREVYAVYRNSVHGKALTDTDNRDVPVCVDCHSAHSIVDPRTPAFHATIPELCAKCHSDEAKMKRNGLTTAAFTTYLEDFHGRSNRLYRQGGVAPSKIVASCTDCHGVHDIQALRAGVQAAGRGQVRERLVESCRKCHRGVDVRFADAWMSHYPVRFDTAPVLWSFKKFYSFFNPFMIGFFVFNVLLNLWRVGVRTNNRREGV